MPVETQASRSDRSASSESEGSSFRLVLVALVVFTGGVLYFIGAVLWAGRDSAAAEARAREQLEAFDPTDFRGEFQTPATTPSTVPSNEGAGAPDTEPPAPSTVPETTGTAALDNPRIDPSEVAMAFINRVPGEEYGLIGYLDASGERHITDFECSRLDLNQNGGICLSATAGLGGSGRGYLLDPSLSEVFRFGVNRPSRAAVSPDGAVVAWTGFSLGHDYLNAGEFATTTQLISVDRKIGVNLESGFRTFRDDLQVDAFERNYWGVTFVDSDRFFATLGLGDETSIVEGRVSNSRIDVVFDNATCPEVSPNGETIVAKERRGDFFQLVAIDLATGIRRDLAEPRSVADQVEWADDDTVVYALPNTEEGTDAQPVFDIYALDLAPGSSPRLLVPFADSPAA